jgi:hypothetical protein
MKKKNNVNEAKYLDDDVACAYETRIPQGHSTRDWAFLPFIFCVMCGVGIFMANDVAVGKVTFWDNAVVWLGLGLALYCIGLGVAMTLWKWQWTAMQMGLFGLCIIVFYYAFSGASLAGALLYGSAPFETKALVLVASLAWNLYWIATTVKKSNEIWQNESLRNRAWVQYKNAVVHRRSGVKDAMDRVGLKLHPQEWIIVVYSILVIPALIWWRKDLSALFGVPFVHIFGIVYGQFVAVLALVGFVMAFMLTIYYPIKIQRMAGKPVLFDMMTRTNAPIPNQG